MVEMDLKYAHQRSIRHRATILTSAMEQHYFGMLSKEQRQSARERFDRQADRDPAV